jgi:hypothetical protein
MSNVQIFRTVEDISVKNLNFITLKKEIKTTKLIKQAFGQNKTPLVEPGFKLLSKVLLSYVINDLKVTDYVGHYVKKAYNNERLALALARVNKIYSFENYRKNDSETELARTFRALFFVASSTEPELFADMVENLKKGVDLNEVDPYFEIVKICIANEEGHLDRYLTTTITDKRGIKTVKVVLTYRGCTAEAFGDMKYKAINKVCEKWLEKYKAKL